MAQLTKTVDQTMVAGSEIFIYTFQVSYSGLTQPSQNGELRDFFPSKIVYALPSIEGAIKNIIQTPVPGGTNVTFQFGAVTAGTTFSFTVACRFGPGRVDNDTFTNTGILYADGESVAEGTAPEVTLTLSENVVLLKELVPPGLIRPNQELTFRISLSNAKDAGADIQNVVITDILPMQLTPVTSFAPIGNDVPSGGYADPTYNGRTGSWNGNTMTFTLPEYHGVRYEIIFKATVNADVISGESFKNIAGWTEDGNVRVGSELILNVFGPDNIFGLLKSGNRTGAVGKPIFYSVVNLNQDTSSLLNYTLTDNLPDEVDITGLDFSSQAAALPTYSIFITTSSGGTLIPIITDHTGNTGSIDLVPFIPVGERITTVQITAPVLQVSSAVHSLHLYGIVNETAAPMETIVNKAVANADGVSKTVLYNTILDGASDLTAGKAFLPLQQAYFPLEEFKFVLATGPLNTFTVNPVFADLMPNSVHYTTDSEYFIYVSSSTGVTYDSRVAGFPVPLPVRSIIDNFDGTGQTLLRWSFDNFTLPMGDLLQVIFTCFVEISPPNTFTNQLYVGNPGKNVLFIYDAVPDTRDYDGDGITDELISGVEVTAAILTSSEFSIKKLVKGNQDLEYGNLGTTTEGGGVSYELLVTNNQLIDLKDLELIDIFPYVGDTGVILTTTPRLSAFYVYPTAEITAEIVNIIGNPVDPNPEITIWYSTGNDPVRFDQLGNPIGTETWSLTPPADITTLRSVKITTGPDVILHPYDRLIVTVQAKTPVGAPLGQVAYNSFAVRGSRIINGEVEPLLPTEPNKVGVRIASPTRAGIGQFVWEDLNGNGIYDAGELGVNGVKVELYDEAMNLIASTVTANNQAMEPGYYTFDGLNPGNYYVKFIPFGTCHLTQQKADQPNGSKPDPTTGLTPIILLAANQHRTDINAGLICQCIKGPYTQAVTDLITSVALEQTALGHILNAEGEKIQKAVSMKLTLDELIQINKSVADMVDAVTQLEAILGNKLQLFECIICEPECM